MCRGDHIFVRRPLGYTHHGVDAGDGTVIHFSGEPGSDKSAATICRSEIAQFAQGGLVRTRRYGSRFSPETAVARAESRLGEAGYHLLVRNCEHFAEWCCTGRNSSRQVVGAVSGTTQVGVLATGVALPGALVASAGSVSGVSAAGIMSGLATWGGIAGGGAALGPGMIGAGPAAVAVGATQVVFRDDYTLPDDERGARRDARWTGAGSAAAATVGGVYAISAAGTTAGLSGAGISSGLAAIGATAGGGMLAGATAVAVAPVAAALGIACASYALSRAIRSSRQSELPVNEEPEDQTDPPLGHDLDSQRPTLV